MKKGMKLFSIALALCIALSLSAFAANFEHCADAMYELDLFRGTNNGYELDREAMRSEAATMLVRLLGAEKEAMKLKYTAPFKDVDNWLKPYVQYLYDKGLTKGTTETTFGSTMKVDSQQYATFLLRALGYVDGEDFTYNTASDFGEKIGVVDRFNTFSSGRKFLRDNIVAMSWTALSLPTKSGEATLLGSLVKSGAISDAKGYDVYLANYRKAMDAVSAYSAAPAKSVRESATVDVTYDGKLNARNVQTMLTNIENNAKVSSKGEQKLVPYEGGKLSVGSFKTIPIEFYYTDGYVYGISNGEKLREKATFDEALGNISVNAIRYAKIPVSAVIRVDGGSFKYAPVALAGELAAESGLKGVTVSVTTSGDALSKITAKVSEKTTKDGKAVELESTLSSDYTEGGAVSLPADLASYKDVK